MTVVLQAFRFANHEHAADLVGLEPERHRAGGARQCDDVVELLAHAIDPEPVGEIARFLGGF